jgi:CheY-specific phosphatase CheX
MEFVDEVVASTQHIWTSVAGLNPHPLCQPATLSRKERLVTCVVQITGAWRGVVIQQCSQELARRVTSTMFGKAPADVITTEIHDVISELTNMLSGSLKARLPRPSQLSLPTVVEGQDYQLVIPNTPMLCQVAFECQGQGLMVTLLHQNTHK